MSKYSISYEEVKQWVEKLPDGEIAGECGEAYHCIVANAIAAKYPHVQAASYNLHNAYVRYADDRYYTVNTDPDTKRLHDLGYAFDDLGQPGTPITKQEALSLFEEVR